MHIVHNTSITVYFNFLLHIFNFSIKSKKYNLILVIIYEHFLYETYNNNKLSKNYPTN